MEIMGIVSIVLGNVGNINANIRRGISYGNSWT